MAASWIKVILQVKVFTDFKKAKADFEQVKKIVFISLTLTKSDFRQIK